MKKLKTKFAKFSFLAAVLFGTFISCSDENSSLESNSNFINGINQRIQLNLNEQVVVKETTKFVSEVFLNMGVTEIRVTSNNNQTEFNAITGKTFGLKGGNVDLAEYPVILEDEFLRLKSLNSTLKLSISGDELYVESSSYSGLVKDEYFYDSLEFNILLFYIREIILDIDNKFDSEIAITTSSQGCSWLNTYYVFAGGISGSMSIVNLQDEISYYTGAGGALSGCRKMGGVDTSCLWENHACLSTQAYCCD